MSELTEFWGYTFSSAEERDALWDRIIQSPEWQPDWGGKLDMQSGPVNARFRIELDACGMPPGIMKRILPDV